MKLIADAGSTKIEWALVGKHGTKPSEEDGSVLRFTTVGFNAAVSPSTALKEIIRAEAPGLLDYAEEIDAIYYYGAGCIRERAEATDAALREVFGTAQCNVESDMLGAARALCGHERGIACILGTGSNSCLYDGEKIIANTPPLGYILGDEGSGAVLGRLFIGRLLKGGFGAEVQSRFRKVFPDTDQSEVIRRVYRCERPNAFLASFAPFIAGCMDIAEVENMVIDEFRRFFTVNVRPYPGSDKLSINFIGSIAHHFHTQLSSAASQLGLTIGSILPSPVPALILFHSNP